MEIIANHLEILTNKMTQLQIKVSKFLKKF